MSSIYLVELINDSFPSWRTRKWAFSSKHDAVDAAYETYKDVVNEYDGRTIVFVTSIPFNDPDGDSKIIIKIDSNMRTESSKKTLAFEDLKRMVRESIRTVHESKPDGAFHAKYLKDLYGFKEDKTIDVYNEDDHKARFYRRPGSTSGIIYSRKSDNTTLTIYNPETGKRGKTISGDYKQISSQIDNFIKNIN